MKKIIFGTIFAVFALVLLVLPTLAAKPGVNNAGAKTYGWNLSGSVMPVPPYGSIDIPGSDTFSKLIVNRPNGNVTTNLTGVMKGLNPNTTYTVYLSNPYNPYKATGWNVTGIWNFDLNSTVWGGTYSKTMTISQDSAGNITGTGGNLPSGNTWNVTGNVSGNTINLTLAYNAPMSGYIATFVGTIDSTGAIQGTWSDNWYSDSGPWHTTSGSAVKTFTGNTGWSGQLNGTVPFTFTTDNEGSGSWHYNFKDVVLTGLSVWINDGGTLLISDSISF